MPPEERLRHLRIEGRAKTERYTTPNMGGGAFRMPPRDRQTHGEELLDQLNQADVEEQAQRAQAEANPGGVVIDFLSAPEFELQLKSLEAARQGIELLNVTMEGDVTVATVFIPNGKLTYFSRRFEKYLHEDTAAGRARHRTLVESISGIR